MRRGAAVHIEQGEPKRGRVLSSVAAP
jgi:hypothetical protein